MENLYSLLFHLRNCPPLFCRTPVYFDVDGIQTYALLADCFRLVSDDYLLDNSALPTESDLNKLGQPAQIGIQVACWLFSHKYFNRPQQKQQIWDGMKTFMFNRLPELSIYVKVEEWIENEDRNEEFVRLAIDCCGLRPDGESENEATDRLDALNTIKRFKVLENSTGAFDRMMEIRRTMAENKAREAANVYGRE